MTRSWEAGTTLAAAEVTERVCYGMELDPKYADVVVERWQGLTGKKATLEGDGRTFAAVQQDRVRLAACVAACDQKRTLPVKKGWPLASATPSSI